MINHVVQTGTWLDHCSLQVCESMDDVRLMVEELMQLPCTVFDSETTGLRAIDDQVVALQFGGTADRAFFIPIAMIDETFTNLSMAEVVPACMPLFTRGLIAHNAGFDWKMMARYVDFNIVADTMIESRLLDSNRKVALKDLATTLLGLSEVVKFKDLFSRKVAKDDRRFDLVPYEQAVPYALQDIFLCYRVHELFRADPGIDPAHPIYQLEHAVIKPLARMELLGVRLNVDLVAKTLEQAQLDLDAEYLNIVAVAGREVALSKTADIRALLYDELKLPVHKASLKTGVPSTDATTLGMLAGHPVVDAILRYREKAKLKEAFLQPLPSLVQSDGAIHTSYDQMGAGTGRLSCRQPNLQQIPKPRGLGNDDIRRAIRAAFLPPTGFIGFLDVDYCLVGETPVETTAGIKPIAEVRPGDYVFTWRDGKIATGAVTKQACVGVLPAWRVTLDSGESFTGTPDHKMVLFDGTPREIRDLKPGDRIAAFRRSYHCVTKVEDLGVLEQMYAITVEPDHNYALGCGVISANSQIEYRIFASLSQDPGLMEAFERDVDIHEQTASIMLGIPLEEVTKDLRGKGKTINFAVLFGAHARRIAETLGITEAEASQLLTQYWAKLPGARQFVEQTKQHVRRYGEIATFFGRRRPLPGIYSKKYGEVLKAERQAVNGAVQGSAADVMKIALVRTDAMLLDRYQSRLVLNVHDQLVIAVHAEDDFDAMAEAVREAMELVIPGWCRLKVDPEYGLNWLDVEPFVFPSRREGAPSPTVTVPSLPPAAATMAMPQEIPPPDHWMTVACTASQAEMVRRELTTVVSPHGLATVRVLVDGVEETYPHLVQLTRELLMALRGQGILYQISPHTQRDMLKVLARS